MEKKTILAGISHGDINGIGYEVIIKALSDPTINDICTTIVYGSPKVAAYHRKALNVNNFSFNNIRTADEAHAKKANMINCLDDNIRVELGKSTPQGGEAALISLEKAVEDLKSGKIDVLITAPIDKQNIQSESFRFKGHGAQSTALRAISLISRHLCVTLFYLCATLCFLSASL